jgi:ADP-ribosyl-[dinitrogen reductase] hydrolase
MDEKLKDRLRGMLVGLAVGDAVGAAVEFKKRDSYPPVTDMLGGGPFNLPVGYWTDDTSMALCLAESLRDCDGLQPVDLLNRFTNWYLRGHNSSTGVCFDIGMTTVNALENFIERGAVENNASRNYSGNGSIMRLAPVVLYYHEDPDLAVSIAAAQSKTTHAYSLAVHSCELLASILHRALHATSKEAALAVKPAEHWADEVKQMTNRDLWSRKRNDIRSSGYVIDTLEAAIWCFYNTDSFDEAVLLATNLGDDTDTVAAVTGQIAGAYYGLSGIRSGWRDQLYALDKIINLADDLTRD